MLEWIIIFLNTYNDVRVYMVCYTVWEKWSPIRFWNIPAVDITLRHWLHIRNSILIAGFRRQFVIYKLALVRDLYRENLSRPNSKGLGTLGSRVHSVLSKYRGSCQKSDGGERSPYCVAYFICTHIICTCLGILRFTLICFISYS